MSDYLKIRQANGTWVARAGGAIIAESKSALELSEGDYPAVIYFPRSDVAMAFFEKSEKSSHCPHKGDATYYGIAAKSGLISEAAWSYEDPSAGASDLKDHIAFYPGKATTEQL